MQRFWFVCGAAALAVCAAFQAPEAKPKIVTGVLLDALDRTPLAEYTFVLKPVADPLAASVEIKPFIERLTTDAAGKFQSVREFPIGALDFEPIDWDSTEHSGKLGGHLLPPHSSKRFPLGSTQGTVSYEDRATAVLAFTGKPLEILMPCGPTFDLNFKHVEIEEEGTGPALAASSARLIATTSGAIDEGLAMSTRVRTLDADHGWARFAALPKTAFVKPHGARLEIVAVDGRWKAVADVTEQLEKRTRKVDLEWQPCTGWKGAVRGVETTALAPHWVTAERLGENDAVVERRRVRVEPGGEYSFAGLDAGRWRIGLQPLRAKPYASEVRKLETGTVHKEPVVLERIETRHSIRGRVAGGPVAKGTTERAVSRVVLRRPRDPLPLDEAWLPWTAEDERWHADFSFDELPDGEFEIDLDTDDVAEFERTTLLAKTGGPDVVFRHR